MSRQPIRRDDGSWNSTDQTPKADPRTCKHPGYRKSNAEDGWLAFCPDCEQEWFIPDPKSKEKK